MKILLAILSVVVLVGCSTVAPGNDPLIVHAQQAKASYIYTADTFLRFEYENRNSIWKKTTEVKKIADRIREQTPEILRLTDEAIARYKAYKMNVNQVELIDRITIITQTIADITQVYNRAKSL